MVLVILLSIIYLLIGLIMITSHYISSWTEDPIEHNNIILEWYEEHWSTQ